MAMNDCDDTVEIDLVELDAHERRVRELLERVELAQDAASVRIGPGAFGLFAQAVGFDEDCAVAEEEGSAMLRDAAVANRDHCGRLGTWKVAIENHEIDAVELFKVVGEDLDAC